MGEIVDKIVSLYRKTEMGIISAVSRSSAAVYDEAEFYDAGYLQTQIALLQKQMSKIEIDIKASLELSDDSEYAINRRSEKISQREHLLYRIVFLASNVRDNLEECLNMAKGHSFDIVVCIEALIEFYKNNKESAFNLLNKYFEMHDGSVEGHFLVNKIYGLLLEGREDYSKAVRYLSYALQFVPYDKDCLLSLHRCYSGMGEPLKTLRLTDILQLLE